MSFDGPDQQDYENVVALNHAYLALLRRDKCLRRGLGGTTDALRQRLLALNQHQTDRLAEAPFLLFSFREQDDLYWNGVLEQCGGADLFRSTVSDEVDTLISAALGFVWQLAKRNPYSLRLFCGASLHWCERIAELTFYRLLDAVRCSGDVPGLRAASHSELWRKLLDNGVCRQNSIRHAAQLCALQTVLTDPTDHRRGDAWGLAARSVRAPGLKVAEEIDRTQR
jgi:hypothetical protein